LYLPTVIHNDTAQDITVVVFVISEVLIAVVMKSIIFWGITLYSPMKAKFANTACCLLHAGFLLGLLFNLKVEATCSSEISSIDFQRLQGVISQKLNKFIAVLFSSELLVTLQIDT
jgi:hypothetical protein